MKLIRFDDRDFDGALADLIAASHRIPSEVMEKVGRIFDDVEERGDAALFEWTERLDRHKLTEKTVKVEEKEIKKALSQVPSSDLNVIELAAKRIKRFHQRQAPKGFVFDDNKGTVIEERVIPLDRVGVCIPGGRAPLASTVLMTVIPARLAGVKEIAMISPWPEGRMNEHVIAAARVAGVDSIYKVGGAQGVAALAAGTASVPRTDKIAGPGSVWVTAAKALAQSRGMCGIDAIAGPSEVLVLADKSADPRLVAIDLLSQVEHGADSIAVLVTDSERLIERTEPELNDQLNELNVTAVLVRDMDQGAEVANLIASEHLEIIAKSWKRLLKKIVNAGSVFVGPYSPVPVGDYMAGANHVLPTGGTARFSSPLGVYDFVKRQSVTQLSREALGSIRDPASRFALMEGLEAHSQSILKRFTE